MSKPDDRTMRVAAAHGKQIILGEGHLVEDFYKWGFAIYTDVTDEQFIIGERWYLMGALGDRRYEGFALFAEYDMRAGRCYFAGTGPLKEYGT